MVYSLSISFISIAIVQMLNLISLDQFYIYRKKQELPIIAEKIKTLSNNPDELNRYIEELTSETGVQVNYSAISTTHKGKNSGNKKNNFLKQTHPTLNEVSLVKTKSGGRYLVYYTLIDKNPLIVNLPLISLENYKYEAFIIQGISIFIALIISFFLGGFFSKKLTKNLEELSDAAHKIADLEFVENLNITSHDEIQELANSIEKMSLKLNESISNLKNFIGNASHELKTPISVINMVSQNLKSNDSLSDKEKSKLYNTLIKETNEMNDLIEKLLLLSKITYSKSSLTFEKINLNNLIKNILYKYELLEIEKNIDMNIKIPKDTIIITDSKFFKIILENLIQNALKYSSDDEEIFIEFKNNQLSIINKINSNIKEDSKLLLEPFKRGSNSLGKEIDGSGLGLSIIKNILDLLNLKFNLEVTENNFIFKIYF